MQYAAAAGGGVSAFGALVQGQQTQNQLNYDAQVQQNNANLALQSASANAAKQSVAATRVLGAMSTEYAANGVSGQSGSVMAAIGASAANAELDRQNILYGGQVKAINYENQASMDQYEGENAKTASYFNAFSSLLTGGATTYGNLSGGGANSAATEDSEYASNDAALEAEMDTTTPSFANADEAMASVQDNYRAGDLSGIAGSSDSSLWVDSNGEPIMGRWRDYGYESGWAGPGW